MGRESAKGVVVKTYHFDFCGSCAMLMGDDSLRVTDRSCFSDATNGERTASRTRIGRWSSPIARLKDRGSASSPIWASWPPKEQDGWSKLGSHLGRPSPARRLQRSLFDPPRRDAPQEDEPLLGEAQQHASGTATRLWRRLVGLGAVADAWAGRIPRRAHRAGARRSVLGHDGGDPHHRPLLRAGQRTAHRRHLVSPHGLGRTTRRDARADPHRPALRAPWTSSCRTRRPWKRIFASGWASCSS